MTYPTTLAMPAATEQPCAAHRFHRPKPAYCELHHLVPQAWQRFWWPGKTGAHDHSIAQPLWYPKVVPLCPTGHRNVHRLIVVMMQACHHAGSDDPLTGWKAVVKVSRSVKERDIAYDALTIFRGHHGSLLDLTSNGLWGEA